MTAAGGPPSSLAGQRQTPSGASDLETAQQVRAAIGRIRARLTRSPSWADGEMRRVCEQVAALLRRGDYRIEISRSRSTMTHVIARELDGSILVNPDPFELLGASEREAVIFHELTHMLPVQTRRTVVAKAIDARLPATPVAKHDALLARTPAGRALRNDYKRLLALEVTNELEAYRWQLAYMTDQAHQRGHATLLDYVDVLARTTRLPPQAEIYRIWAEAMRQDRIDERLVIGHVLNVAGPGEWPLLRALAADEGADVSSAEAIDAWLVSWAMDPAYSELPEPDSWRAWAAAMGGALLLLLLGLHRWRKRATLRDRCRAS